MAHVLSRAHNLGGPSCWQVQPIDTPTIAWSVMNAVQSADGRYITHLCAGGALLAMPLLSDKAVAEADTNKSVISVRGLSAFQRSAQRNYLSVSTWPALHVPPAHRQPA